MPILWNPCKIAIIEGSPLIAELDTSSYFIYDKQVLRIKLGSWDRGKTLSLSQDKQQKGS